MKGMTITMDDGGAERVKRESLLMKDATSVEGKCLPKIKFGTMSIVQCYDGAYVDERKSSVSLKNLARCFKWSTSLSRNLYNRV
jgi:hypothetical protein